MKKKTRVLIVDDSSLIRSLFTEMLNSDPGIEVIGTASDPYDAREKIKQLNPDVITLDVEMPKMDGLSFLEKIMSLRPMPVVMASTLTQKGAETTIRALEIGAIDYVSKPTTSQTRDTLSALKDELIAKVKIAAKARVRSNQHAHANNNVDESLILPFTPSAITKRKIIAIGSSTGGVEALREIIVRLPSNCPPVVITQHMPETFTASFAARLNKLSAVTVHEASDGQRIETGHVYIAPGGKHLEIHATGKDSYLCKVSDGMLVSGHKPSVDVLFRSVAKAVKDNAVGVILTGMGKDGAEGMRDMKLAGALTLGQNEETCVVYGMPKAAKMNQAVDVEISLGKMAEEILKRCNTES